MTPRIIGILIILAFVWFTNILDVMVLMPMAPIIKNSFNVDSGEFGILVGSYSIAAFISAIIATFWADKYDRKKSLLIVYAGFAVGTFLCALSKDYANFLIIRFITGLFGGILGSISMSIVSDLVAPNFRGRAMGILMGGFALASILGVPLGIYLSGIYGWQSPFYFIAGMAIIVFLCILFFIPTINKHLQAENKLSAMDFYIGIFKNKNTLIALTFSVCLVMSHFAIIPYISDYLVNNVGLDLKTEIVFIYLVGGAMSFITSPVWGWLSDKYGRLMVLGFQTIIAIIPIYLISNYDSKLFVMLISTAALFFVFSGGRFVPSNALITTTVTPQNRGRFMSLNSAIQQLGTGLMTFLGSRIIYNDEIKKLHNYNIIGYIGIALTILALFFASRIKQTES